MTCRRIIAGVILLAAVAVAVPFWPGVWRKVAYREEVSSVTMRIGDQQKTAEMVWLIKRWSWLPVPSVLPDQICRECSLDSHEECSEEHYAEMLGRFRCTCTDPSHDGGTE